MKDLAHHVKHVQKKVLQASRKESAREAMKFNYATNGVVVHSETLHQVQVANTHPPSNNSRVAQINHRSSVH